MLKTVLRFLAGPLVLLVSIAGIIHGIHACLAQNLYFRVRYGVLKESDAESILAACERSYQLYPFNYNLCSIATDVAFLEADRASDQVLRGRLLSDSGKWCERGLALNTYSRDLNLRKAGLLGAGGGGASKAAAHWERYTDWQYWNPVNHYILGQMYIWAGELEKAKRCAVLVDKWEYGALLMEAIDDERARQAGLQTGRAIPE